MNETLSDTLDIQAKIQARNERREAIKLGKYYIKREKEIIRELEKAKNILGHRFSYKRQHDSMYYFYFNYSLNTSSGNLVFYVCPESPIYTPINKVNLDITSYMNNYKYDFDHLNNIKLKDLSNKIVEAINLAVNDF